jgi:nucleolar MIF4G domain-containing protein 1
VDPFDVSDDEVGVVVTKGWGDEKKTKGKGKAAEVDPFDVSDDEGQVVTKGWGDEPAPKKKPELSKSKSKKRDEVDPFDVSDDEDLVVAKGWGDEKEEKKGKKEKKEKKKREEVDPFDVSDDDDEGLVFTKGWGDEPAPKKKPEPPKPKSILKKRKAPSANEEPTHEEEPPKKKINKAVQDRLAQDDAEIEYLEKKLKIKNKKVPKSFNDDGLDFLLEGLDQDFLDDRKEKAKRINERKRKMMEGSEDEEDSDEGDEDALMDEMIGDLEKDLEMDGEDDEDEDGSDEEGDEDGLGSGDDEEGSDEDSETEKAPAPRVRENPYKPGITATAATEEKPVSKYIPPSLRKATGSESERLTRLRRQLQGLINRLSEAKLIPMLGDFEEVYRTNPRADVTNIITDILITTLCDSSALNDTYHILHSGFLAGLYKIMGTDVGATVVQRIVEEFLSQHKKANGISDPSTAGKECTNLISFLSELYNFQVISCVLIFDFIRMFLSELTELHTELLLKIVRNSGPQLRSDDPSALKSLVLLLQPSIAKAGGLENLSVRTKFMIETLTNLKNNRLKSTTATAVVTAEHTVRMKKLLGSLSTRSLRAREPLRASLDDIQNVETKGKWWLVGASWAGTSTSETKPTQIGEEQPAVPAYVSDSDDDAGIPDLQALARQHRMNTDIRRAIFITLLSSTDYTDAYTKLLKLRLKRTQEREIPRVLLHCAAAEGTYNPYYTLVAKKLCGGHALRMTFTFTLWDYFRRFGEDDGSGNQPNEEEPDDSDDEGLGAEQVWRKPAGLRKIVNLARLYAALVVSGSLQLSILKTLNWSYLQAPTKSFLEVFFTTILTETRGDAFEVAAVFGKIAENVELVRGLLYFVKKRVAKTGGVAAEEEERKLVKKSAQAAVNTLQEILRNTVVGDD